MKQFLLFLVLWGVASVALATEESRLDRYALIVGSNQGGETRVPLRYANSDAKSVVKVLEELGGLSSANRTLLLNPESAAIDDAFNKIVKAVANGRESKRRQEMIFYYSGHSDDKGLLLSDGRYPYTKLKQHIQSLDVDIRVALLDSCESESFMKTKGGKRLQPLQINDANKVKGYVFLAASSENEAAQESKKIKGSYFTHYFVSALRGAGDITADKKVTLNEAYQHAYHETLLRTKNTRAGAQHAAYDMQLTGAGDLVLTDLHRSTATLSLDEDVGGRVFVHSGNGRLVVELSKLKGKRLDVGLSPDVYDVLVRDDEVMSARANLEDNLVAVVSASDFTSVDLEETTLRGANLSANKRFRRRTNSDNKFLFSFGYFSRKMRFSVDRHDFVSDGWVNWDYGSNFSKNQYRGISLGTNLLINRKVELAVDGYLSEDTGYLYGVSGGMSYNVLNDKFYRLNTVWNFGLGASIDVLRGFWNEDNPPLYAQEYLEQSVYFSPYISTGLRFGLEQYSLILDVRQKMAYSDKEKDERDLFPEFVLRIGMAI